MSLTAQIGSSDVAFKLTQKVVASLAEKFAFKFEDGWNTISTRSVENIQKRLKREKRRSNPTSSIKHPRTSFSFFTQRQRPISQAAHPAATFGELSRFVSEAWKALTPAQMAEYKALETTDKVRYQTERTALLASTPEASVEVSTEVVEPVKEKRVKTPKTPKVVEASTPAAAAPAAKAEKVKTPKAPKAAKAAAEVVVAEAAPVVAEVKSAKAPKAKKAEAAAAAPAATPAVEAAAPVKAAKPASAPKAAKAVKA
jgi:hypothetical protein